METLLITLSIISLVIGTLGVIGLWAATVWHFRSKYTALANFLLIMSVLLTLLLVVTYNAVFGWTFPFDFDLPGMF